MASMLRSIDLRPAAADEWFERLLADAPGFTQLCEAIGERVVAFSIVAGVRITAIALDRGHTDASNVTFVVGDSEEEHELILSELRYRLGESLAGEDNPPTFELSENPSVDEIQRLIGYRLILLAPIFGTRLVELTLSEAETFLTIGRGDTREVMTLRAYRDEVRARVRSECAVQRRSTPPFSADLAAVNEAEAASAEGDWEKVVDLLGEWPGPMAMLGRTHEGRTLAPETKSTIALGLGLLGTAHTRLGNPDWGEEVLRLGVQWAQDVGGDVAARLFLWLADVLVMRGQDSAAVALLQRSLTLGASPVLVQPALAAALSRLGRRLPALALALEARGQGVRTEANDALIADIEKELGSAWTNFTSAFPEWGSA